MMLAHAKDSGVDHGKRKEKPQSSLYTWKGAFAFTLSQLDATSFVDSDKHLDKTSSQPA